MNKVSIKKERIELKSLINDNIQLLSSMSVKKTQFINDVEEGVTAFADQNMINLVFRNLILNGIKFTDNGGVIKISATKSKNEITVSIADNGVGISPEVQQLAKEFIERNGGKIKLESELKKGTTFFVTIPVG
jgi:signal transduction histidine kinase